MMNKVVSTLLIIFFVNAPLQAQTNTGYTVPIALQYVDYKIDDAQKRLLALDGIADGELRGSSNPDINLLLTYAATSKIDGLQKSIELDTVFTNNQKLTYLRGLTELMDNFIVAFRSKKLKLIQFPDVLKTWEECFELDKEHKSIAPIMFKHPSEISAIAIRGIGFNDNAGIPDARNNIVLKSIQEQPDKLMQTLSRNPDLPFTDSLLSIAVKRKPEELYNYAQATNTRLGQRIHRSSDFAIKQICDLAEDKSGRLYFPFLDNIFKRQNDQKQHKKNNGRPGCLF